MTKTVNFDQDFVSAITGFQEKKTPKGTETHINVGQNTVCIDTDLKGVLSQIFPCTLTKPTPFTYMQPGILHTRGNIMPNLSIHTFRDPIGW